MKGPRKREASQPAENCWLWENLVSNMVLYTWAEKNCWLCLNLVEKYGSVFGAKKIADCGKILWNNMFLYLGQKKLLIVVKFRGTLWFCTWGKKNCWLWSNFVEQYGSVLGAKKIANCCQISWNISTTTSIDNLRSQPAFGRLRNKE